MDYMLMPFRRYAEFSGRSRRKEHWMFFLLNLCVMLVLLLLSGGFGAAAEEPSLLFLTLYFVYALAVLVPSIAVIIRRFHDQDKTGWLALLIFVPFVGGIIVLVFMLIEGTHGPNRYGPDPKAGEPDHGSQAA